MITLRINGVSVRAEEGTTLLQAALSAGIRVTHLCSGFDEDVKKNCGLCLVKTQGRDGLVLACETVVEEGMDVSTDTPEVREAVKKRAERLFAGHPADCAGCFKAGACVVQDICAAYRPEIAPEKKKRSKRKLLDWIECDDAKCVGCGRCGAFLKKIGVGDGAAKPPESCPAFPFSGTLTDLCPAGALTDVMPELKCSWEIKHTRSIDVTDCVGAEIDLQSADGKIIRAVPAGPDGLISDKARFCMDGLCSNRLDRPYKRVDGRLKECGWDEALRFAAEKIKSVSPDKMAGLIGDYADCESMLALRDLFALKGASAIDARPAEEMYFDLKSRQSRLFNTPFSRIREADALICVGADIDTLAPAVAWRLRQNPMPKAFVGKKTASCLPYEVLSETPAVLEDILRGSGGGAELLRQAKKPMIILGSAVLKRPDAAAVADLVYRISKQYGVIGKEWNGYNFLTDKTTVLGALELGVVSESSLMPRIRDGRFDFVWLLDEDRFSHADAPDAFVVYQGIYASDAAKTADLVLPALSFAEKRATYLNAQGQAQSTSVALPPFGRSREDWKILRALSDYLETAPLPYNDLDDIRDALGGRSVVFYEREKIHKAEDTPFGVAGKLSDEPIVCVADPFADELSRQSERAKILRWRNR